jgi:SAM-dependent methyltransferase
LRTPALKALLAQICAYILAHIIFLTLSLSPVSQLTLFLVVDGVLAAVFSVLLKLDWWWWLLGLVFPTLVIAALWIDLPTWVYLAGFIALTLIYWSVFITQVPYFPTDPQVFPEVHKLLPSAQNVSFCEIGSGIGSLSLYLAKHRNDAHILGVEIAPIPWFISVLKARLSGCNAKFLLGSYESLDFSQFDVIYAYLSPAAMPSLWQKAQTEMKVGSLLISYEFTIPNFPPDLCVNIATNGTFIYIWRI